MRVTNRGHFGLLSGGCSHQPGRKRNSFIATLKSNFFWVVYEGVVNLGEPQTGLGGTEPLGARSHLILLLQAALLCWQESLAREHQPEEDVQACREDRFHVPLIPAL